MKKLLLALGLVLGVGSLSACGGTYYGGSGYSSHHHVVVVHHYHTPVVHVHHTTIIHSHSTVRRTVPTRRTSVSSRPRVNLTKSSVSRSTSSVRSVPSRSFSSSRSSRH